MRPDRIHMISGWLFILLINVAFVFAGGTVLSWQGVLMIVGIVGLGASSANEERAKSKWYVVRDPGGPYRTAQEPDAAQRRVEARAAIVTLRRLVIRQRAHPETCCAYPHTTANAMEHAADVLEAELDRTERAGERPPPTPIPFEGTKVRS